MEHEYRIGPWRFVWYGGRLADVHHIESDTALDCFQVGDYDWKAGRSNATVTDFRNDAHEWVRDSSADYARELPYLL